MSIFYCIVLFVLFAWMLVPIKTKAGDRKKQSWAAYPFDSPSRWEVKKKANVLFWGDELWVSCKLLGMMNYMMNSPPRTGNPLMFICWQLDFFWCFFFHNSLRWQICRAFRFDHDARQDCGFSGQSKSFGLSGNGAWCLVGLECKELWWNDSNRKKWTKCLRWMFQ